MTVDVVAFKEELLTAGLPVTDITDQPSDEFPDCTIVWDMNFFNPFKYSWRMVIIPEPMWEKVRLLYAAHDPTKTLPQTQLAKDAYAGYLTLPTWVKTGTADDAQTYISNQIWNGFTIEQANTYIDNTIGTVTGSNLTQALASLNTQLGNVKVVFKAVASAVIALRDLFVITSKLLIYFRDFVIRVRTGG